MIKYLSKNKKILFLLILTTVVSRATIALLPLIVGRFISDFDALTGVKIGILAAVFVVDVVLILLFEFFLKLIYAKFYERLMVSLKNDLFGKIFQMSQEEFRSNDTDFYLNIFMEDVKTLYSDYYDTITGMLVGLISLLVYSAVVFYLNWIMALAIIAAGLFSLLIPKLAGGKLSEKRKNNSKMNAAYIGKLKDMLTGFSVNTPLTRGKLTKEHDDANIRKEDTTYAYNKYASSVEILGGLSLYFLNIVVFIAGMVLIKLDYLALSGFVVLISFTDIMVLPIRDIIFQIISLKSSAGIKNKVYEILNKPVSNTKKAATFNKSIEVINVEYGVEDFKLNIPSLVLEKGKKYAVVGRSGSGKTTLLKIILGYIDSYVGDVTIDGESVRDVDVTKIISDINQNAYIFNGSAVDNITLFGSYPCDDIEKLADTLNAREIIRESLGEFGSNISGGERNKIALMRAVNKGCSVLICDEMLSALDERSRNDINEFIFSNSDLTVLSVTHDLQSLKYYDAVIVMNKGEISKILQKNHSGYNPEDVLVW